MALPLLRAINGPASPEGYYWPFSTVPGLLLALFHCSWAITGPASPEGYYWPLPLLRAIIDPISSWAIIDPIPSWAINNPSPAGLFNTPSTTGATYRAGCYAIPERARQGPFRALSRYTCRTDTS